MTDKEIIKAFVGCEDNSIMCADCPYGNSDDCLKDAHNDIINIINRQQTEIEKARAEAIKEFVDRILSYIDVGHLRPPTEICFSDLDVRQIVEKIANEMVGAE